MIVDISYMNEINRTLPPLVWHVLSVLHKSTFLPLLWYVLNWTVPFNRLCKQRGS